jgi:hypothetical protein
LWEQLRLLQKKASGTDDVSTSIWEQLAFTRELLRAERQHNEYTKAAVQAQVQMVHNFPPYSPATDF